MKIGKFLLDLPALVLVLSAHAQQSVTVGSYMAVLKTDAKTITIGIPTTLDFEIMNASSMAPSQGLSIAASVAMSAMPGMALASPKVMPGDKSGHYDVQVNFPEAGEYKLDLTVKSSSSKVVSLAFKITPGSVAAGSKSGMSDMQSMPGMKGMEGSKAMQGLHNMHGMPGMQMKSFLGNWSANRTQGSANSNAWLPEATYYHANEAFFARFECVDKGELVDVPMGNYTINKLLFGNAHTFCRKDQLDYGLGAYAGVYSFPSSLNPFYGKNPNTFGLLFRIRPSKR